MRRSTMVLGCFAGIIGAGLFQLKYEVMRLESQYKSLNHTVASTENSISILKAEWTHLTNPEHLQRLAQKHLGVEQISRQQIISFRPQKLSPLGQGPAALQQVKQERPLSPLKNDNEIDDLIDTLMD